jgi:hypothetical protein
MSRDGERRRRAQSKLYAIRSEMSLREAADHNERALDVCRLFGWCPGCASEPLVCACVCATCGELLSKHELRAERVVMGEDVHARMCLSRREV